MKYRTLGKTGFKVSEVSLGTWQLGGRWGEKFNFNTAEEILSRAVDGGVNFIDTADVYNEGQSEKAIGKFLKGTKEKIYVTTKAGRRLVPHTTEGYNRENIIRFVDDSLKNMDMEVIDLIQLHCPTTEVYRNPEVFGILDELVEKGKILNYGVSVEKVEEALKAIEYPNMATVQIIYNMFRHKPAEKFFDLAKSRNVGIIARVPLASGMLSGKFKKDTVFSKGDHRFFNREGQVFDKGETFSGVPYEIGLEAVEELKKIFTEGKLAEYALRWILMNDNVSCIIPGASRASQVEDNIKASDLSPLTDDQMEGVKEIYQKYVKRYVYELW